MPTLSFPEKPWGLSTRVQATGYFVLPQLSFPTPQTTQLPLDPSLGKAGFKESEEPVSLHLATSSCCLKYVFLLF